MRFLPILLLVFATSRTFALELDGITEFAQRVQLNSSVSARVESILVSPGQQVTRGELLLRLGTTALQASVDQARAGVDALAPTMARMQTELEKAQELFDRDSLALVALQHAEQDYAVAQANLAAAEAKLVRAEYLLSQAEIRAPISGVVLAIEAAPGLYINTRVADRSLLTLADNRYMLATVLLPLEHWSEELLHRSARVSYRDSNYQGRVTQLGRQVTSGENNHPATVLQIRFEANGRIPAGLPVRISIADE